MMLSAIAIAVVMVRQWGFASRLTFIPRIGSGSSHPPRRGTGRPSGAQARRTSDRRGSVVEGPWSAPVPPPPTADAASAQVELDELLDKISAGGLDSLSADEKRRLNELSKRLR